MYIPWTSDQLADKDWTDAQAQFMAGICLRLGSQVLPRELDDIELENTPQYDPYEDETQNKPTFPQVAGELELMPEVGYHFIGAEILLPKGDEMARSHVVACAMPVEIFWAWLIQIQFLILRHIKLSLL